MTICPLLDIETKTQELLPRGKVVKKFASINKDKLFEKLTLVETAKRLQNLNTPSNNLEALKGDRKDQYSIRANKRWRICFNWSDSESRAYNIEIVDYH